jgi:hypothetical protein
MNTSINTAVIMMSTLILSLLVLLLILGIIYIYSNHENKNMTFMTFLRENFEMKESTESKEQQQPPPEQSSLNFKSIQKMFQNMQYFITSIIPTSRFTFFKYPLLLFVLTLGYIILFRADSNNLSLRFFKSNEKTLLPLLLAIYGGVLYKSYRSSYFDYEKGEFNKIKSVILFFCVLATIVNLFVTDPGQYISNNFAPSMLLLILATAVLFFQTSVDLLHGVYVKKQGGGSSSTTNTNSFYQQMGDFISNPKYQLFNYIFNFLVVFLLSTLTMYYYSTSSKKVFMQLLLSTSIIAIIWSSFSAWLYFRNNSSITVNNFVLMSSKAKKSLQLMLMMLLLIITIIWASYFVFTNATLTSSGKVVSILIMCVLLSILYKYIHAKYYNGKSIDRVSTFLDILINVVFWLPCLVTDVLQYIFSLGKSNLFSSVDKLSIAIVSIMAGLILVYLNARKINQNIISQNGLILFSDPLYLNEVAFFPSPIHIHKQTDYALSFWCYFHTTAAVSTDIYSIINLCGNECNVSYNPQENMIYVGHKNKLPSTETYTEDNIPLVFKEKMILQKWNNVILNFSNSSLDIFVNGQLKHSESNIVSRLNEELLQIGHQNGMQGGIRQLTCYNRPLTFLNIYMINNAPAIIK